MELNKITKSDLEFLKQHDPKMYTEFKLSISDNLFNTCKNKTLLEDKIASYEKIVDLVNEELKESTISALNNAKKVLANMEAEIKYLNDVLIMFVEITQSKLN